VAAVALLCTALSAGCGGGAPAPASGDQRGAGGAQAVPAPTLQISAPQSAPRSLTKLRLATAAVDFGYLPLFVGMEKGFFAEEGLEIEYTTMAANASTAALIVGEIDVGPDGGAARAAAQGAPTRTVVWYYRGTTFQFMVSPEIQTPADLVGKVVAVSSYGATNDIASRLVVEKALGIDPQRVQWMPVGYTNIPAALEAKQAVGGGLNPDLAARMAVMGYRKMASSSEVMPTPFSGMSFRQDFIQNQRDLVKAFIRASIRSLRFTYDQPDETAVLASSILGLEPEIARAALPLTRDVINPNDWGGGREEGFQLIVETIRDELNLPSLRIDDLVDISVLREVQAELGLPCTGGYKCTR
jgi:ABC-type nitrate/sulfonate/bicarbonate transport system substrate-binding protein